MKFEVIEEIEMIARYISVGKQGLWLKEMVNVQSLFGDLKQEYPRLLAMIHTFDGFCWERLFICRERHELLAC